MSAPSWFYFVDYVEYVEAPGSYTLDLPEGISSWFSVLAAPGRATGDKAEPAPPSYCLFEADIPLYESHSYPQCQPVSDMFWVLINSAKRYPPALALAGADMEHLTDPTMSRARFAYTYAERLRFYLRNQRDAPYFLAEVRKPKRTEKDEYYYSFKWAGEFVWVLDYKRGRGVAWVCDDVIIFRDPLSHFNIDMDAAELAARFSDVKIRTHR